MKDTGMSAADAAKHFDDIDESVIEYASNAENAGKTTKQFAKSLKETPKALKAVKAALVSMVVVFVITKVIEGIIEIANATEKLKEKAQER